MLVSTCWGGRRVILTRQLGNGQKWTDQKRGIRQMDKLPENILPKEGENPCPGHGIRAGGKKAKQEISFSYPVPGQVLHVCVHDFWECPYMGVLDHLIHTQTPFESFIHNICIYIQHITSMTYLLSTTKTINPWWCNWLYLRLMCHWMLRMSISELLPTSKQLCYAQPHVVELPKCLFEDNASLYPVLVQPGVRVCSWGPGA